MIKRLLGCVREYKVYAILTPIFIILEVLLETMIPTVMGMIIDQGIMVGNMNRILQLGGILAIMALFSLACGMGNGYTGAIASTGFAKNLRHDMYYAIQDYSFTNIDEFSTGSLVTRLTTDVNSIQMAFQMCLRIAFRAPLMLITSLILAIRISSKLSIVFLVAFAILSVVIGFLMKYVMPIFQRLFKGYDRLNTTVQENLNGIRVVKSNVREDFEVNKFKDAVQYIYDNNTKANRYMAMVMPIMTIVMFGTILYISYMGGLDVIGLTLSTGELTTLLTYVNQILMSFMMVSMVIVMITQSQAAAKRVAEVLEAKSDIVNKQHPIEKISDGSIDFEHVSFKYNVDDESNALSVIDCHIASGETIGIIGTTGCGKTSFVSLIPRLYDASEGCVKVGGIDVKDYDLNTLRDNVAMVLQQNILFSGTIRENLQWGDAKASDEQIRHACDIACASEFIDKMPNGLDTYIEQGGTNVSGGQKQRLCIARALLKHPKILILDDSTSACDTHTDATIQHAFITEIPDVTKIIIAQRISSVQNCDRIIVLENGKINAIGNHEQLLASNGIYQQVYQSQTKGESNESK